jgi:hypothetical protein
MVASSKHWQKQHPQSSFAREIPILKTPGPDFFFSLEALNKKPPCCCCCCDFFPRMLDGVFEDPLFSPRVFFSNSSFVSPHHRGLIRECSEGE